MNNFILQGKDIGKYGTVSLKGLKVALARKIGVYFSLRGWPFWKMSGSLNVNGAKALHEDELETMLHCSVYFDFQAKNNGLKLFWLLSCNPLMLLKKWKYSFTWLALVKPSFLFLAQFFCHT